MVCSEAARLWLEILSAKGIGPETWVNLSRRMPLEMISRMLADAEGREHLSRRLGRAVKTPDRAFVDEQLALLEKGGCGLLSISDEAYPGMLREICVPPPLLFCRGELSALSRRTICIVGSRRASRRGKLTAAGLARELSELGIHVVSGLARGIDGAAHEGAIGGEGGTSAVLGCGVDVVYPPEHGGLAREIERRGCIVSEFPLGTPPLKHHFPRRNRILSGLSLGVVVVEADLDSGAMGTAQWACEQNREVFAVPGPIDYPGSRGPHKLIREGSTLVEGIADILVEIPLFARSASRADSSGEAGANERLTNDERVVLSALDLNPKHIDELVQFCHISPTIMLPLLLDLEMRGIVESCGAGTYALASPGKRL
ncbi:MAG TPA: DNA-processing protein DprA [Candidatus Bathyarchaeia archaeon]|nr:DNA-processing protein DprA [Candidatus Bathyarchaeia archaeon]